VAQDTRCRAGSTRPRTASRCSSSSERDFRYYWIATFFYFLVFGAQRFAFVLLVLELTDRAGLGGVAGFALGIPAFFITLPAGVWADRLRPAQDGDGGERGGFVVMTVAAMFAVTGC
jgi:hypothetical protein